MYSGPEGLRHGTSRRSVCYGLQVILLYDRIGWSSSAALRAPKHMSTETYVIAVKRERRGSEPADWKEQVCHASGIQVVSTNSSRLQVRATDEAIDRFRSHWGDLLHIEKQIIHKPQSAASA